MFQLVLATGFKEVQLGMFVPILVIAGVAGLICAWLRVEVLAICCGVVSAIVGGLSFLFAIGEHGLVGLVDFICGLAAIAIAYGLIFVKRKPLGPFDKIEARDIAQKWIDTQCANTKVVIMDKLTKEFHFGWVFFYQSESFMESRNPRDSLVGNAPLIVDSADGSVHVTGTARPIAHYISEYKRTRKKNR